MEKTSGKYQVLSIYVLLAGISFVVYEQVLRCKFTDFDDTVYVTENQHVKAGLTRQSILWAFESPRVNFWHPVTMLSHMLDCELFGLKPWGHHLTSLLLHIANTLLLFWFLKDMTGAVWKSWFVAVLFSVHPLHAESVAWISERKDVLSTLFWMLTMAAYLRYVRRRTAWRYLLSLVLFALGLMAKPMLVTLPFVLLLLDYWPLKRLQNKKDIYRPALEKIPFFVLSAAFSVVAFFAQGDTEEFWRRIPVKIRIANAFISYAWYIQKMFWPSRLAVFYPHPGDKLSMLEAAAAFVILAGVSIWIIYSVSRRKYLLVGWLWYVGTLVPVIGLVQVGEFATADRYTYMPLTGLFIIIVWGADELLAGWRWRKIAMGASASTVLLALSICTGLQLRYWQNSVTLFEHALKVTNNNYLAYHNLGFAYIELGRYNEAIEVCKQAIRIRSDDSKAHNNLGVAYGCLGRYDESIENCKEAIKIKPNYAKAHYNLGTAYMQTGRYNEAIESYKQAIKIEPDYAPTYCNLGYIYGILGRYNEVIESYKEAIKIEPSLAAGVYYNLGIAYLEIGDRSSALEEYKILKNLDKRKADKLFGLIQK
jgi:Tfp pilus assembly protein PilF